MLWASYCIEIIMYMFMGCEKVDQLGWMNQIICKRTCTWYIAMNMGWMWVNGLIFGWFKCFKCCSLKISSHKILNIDIKFDILKRGLYYLQVSIICIMYHLHYVSFASTVAHFEIDIFYFVLFLVDLICYIIITVVIC